MDPDPPVRPSHGQASTTVSSQSPLYGSQASSKTKASGKPRLRFAEEQRASWPKSWHSKSDKGEKKGEKSEKSGGPPGVYWSDDAEANESHYTFYREGTPTPPDYDEEAERVIRQARAMGLTGGGGARQPQTLPSFDPPPERPYGSRVCGMRRGLFWALVILAGIILIGVGIGTGVGVGLAKNVTPATTVTPANATAAGGASGTSSPGASSTSSATSTDPSMAPCEGNNNTIFEVPNSKKTFRRFCGIDYGPEDGTIDITHVLTSSMEECMVSCSGLANCTGCSWGVIANDTGPRYRCWLKRNLQAAHYANPYWNFAVLQS